MPIVSTWVGRDKTQADGTRHVHEYQEDQNGKIYRRAMYAVPAADDALALALARVPELDARLLLRERRNIEHSIETGADPNTIERRHLTPRQAIKPILRGFMRSTISLNMVRTAEFIRDKLSNSALDGEFSVAIRQRIRARQDAVIARKADLIADRASQEEL